MSSKKMMAPKRKKNLKKNFYLLGMVFMLSLILASCASSSKNKVKRPSAVMHSTGYAGCPETVITNRGDYCIIKITVDSDKYDYVIDKILYSEDKAKAAVFIKDMSTSYKWQDGNNYYWTFTVPLLHEVDEISLERE